VEDVAFLNALQAGTLSRQQVAAAVLASGEYRTNLIASFYDDFLERAPAGPEIEAWLAALAAGQRREAVAAAFVAANEYLV
jgi:hypothetical protein